jgi:hypothetical protein
MMKTRLSRDAGRHVVLDITMLDDSRLSFRAKGLLAYLIAHPGLDLSNNRTLAAVSLEGVDALGTALKELEDAGYFRPRDEVGEDGQSRRVGVVYPVSRIPILEPQSPDTPHPSQPEGRASSRASSLKGAAGDTPAVRIIARLNELRKQAWEWARYTPLSAKHAKNIEHINGRLADGYSESDLFLVLEYLAAVDGGKEESRKYFDCVTPFNTKNFERNLTMAREWEARGRPMLRSKEQERLIQSHDPSIYDRGRRGGQS